MLSYFQNVLLPEITSKLDPNFVSRHRPSFRQMIGCHKQAPKQKCFCSRDCEKNVEGPK